MTKLNFHKNTRVQVNKTIRMVADCLATVRIHGRERERGVLSIGTFKKYEFDFWKVHGIMKTFFLQSK